MTRLICIQSSCDYSFINICDFKATHKQVIFQDMRFSDWCWWKYISARMWCHFYHWIVTNIWEELAASNNSNERVSRAFFTYRPQSPMNKVASKDKMSPFKIPTKGPPFMVCQWAPYGEIPAFRTCFYVSLRIPSKGALPPGSPRSGAIESDIQLLEPPLSISWSPQ